ncbi:MAG: hypothetical protein AMXMBFR57_05770 [Acidimicrobiia bacterium]|jgi:spore germination protein GerM
MPWRTIGISVAVVAVAIWLLSLWLPDLLSPTPASRVDGTEASQVSGATDARRIHASLFYVSASGLTLDGVDREVPYAPSPGAQARAIVEAQLAAPPPGRVSAVPQGVQVRSLYLTARGEAFVDLSGDIVTNHPGGSLAEALTVYAIVSAVTINLPDVTRVQILIDGREVDTLAGHVDLRHPLARDSRWIAQ